MAAISRSASGVSGRLRCGYQEAAAIGAWRLALGEAVPRRYVLEGAARIVSDYWLGEEPLTLELAVGPDRWIWERFDGSVAGGRITATIDGPPRIERGAAQG